MAQLEEGGFLLKHQDPSGSWKTSGYVYAEDIDLLHSVEHWVMVVDPVPGADEIEFQVPVLGTPSTDAKIVRDSSNYNNQLSQFLDLRYHTPVAGGHTRRYIRCDCTKMSL